MCHRGHRFRRLHRAPIVGSMFAVYAARIDRDHRRSPALSWGASGSPGRPGWSTITVRAASLNHHDLWSLRGVGLPEDKLPMILGYATPQGLTRTATRSSCTPSSARPATASAPTSRAPSSPSATRAPSPNRSPSPRGTSCPSRKELSFAEAACLPTAWLTAYRMLLFTNAGVRPGDSVLVQGAGGGVATAAIVLGKAAGLRVFATSRDEAKRKRALNWAPWRPVEPGGAAASGWTPSSRPWAPPPGPTR